MSDTPTNERCGPYELIERIALGGMAEVWRAQSQTTDGVTKVVALKRPLARYAADEDFRKMFIDEARLAAQVSHPNIAQILDLGEVDNRLYIAMELLDGVNLRELSQLHTTRKQAIPAQLTAYIIAKAAEALHAAHLARDHRGNSLGLVHRDMSPHNVILTRDGDVKLVDFGIARAEQRLSQTQAGVVKGKVRYLSPELLKGHEASPQSDIFALGLIMAELLSGEQVINGANDLENFKLISTIRPTELIARFSSSLAPFGAVLLKMLDPEPAKRFTEAEEIAEQLERYLIEERGIYGRVQAARHLKLVEHHEEPVAKPRAEPAVVTSTPASVAPPEDPTRFGEPAAVEPIAPAGDADGRKDWKNIETHRWDVTPAMLAAARRSARLKAFGLSVIAAILGALFVAWVMNLGQ